MRKGGRRGEGRAGREAERESVKQSKMKQVPSTALGFV